ncbi:hypothetical protein GmHk_07G019716 [Glycine max]|nr:hypothetical protein GmHk_07G019716 [Glycine max]
MKAQVEKDEGPEAETLSRLLITYQGNPCGVYPDLSSFTGSGVIQNLCSLYQAIRSYSGSHHLVSELRLLIQNLRGSEW